MEATSLGEKVTVPALGSGVVIAVNKLTGTRTIQLWTGETFDALPQHAIISQGSFVSPALLGSRPARAFSDQDALTQLLN